MINTPGTWPKKKNKNLNKLQLTQNLERQESIFVFNAEMVKLLEYRSTGDISNEATS